jgi:hypothetical protein
MQKATDWLVRNKVDRGLNRILDLADKTAAKGGAESQRHAASSDCSRCKAKHGSTMAGLPAWIHVEISCWLLVSGLACCTCYTTFLIRAKSSCQVLPSQAKVGPLVVQVQLLSKLQLP